MGRLMEVTTHFLGYRIKTADLGYQYNGYGYAYKYLCYGGGRFPFQGQNEIKLRSTQLCSLIQY